jgi:hypothetical protein
MGIGWPISNFYCRDIDAAPRNWYNEAIDTRLCVGVRHDGHFSETE